MSVDDFSIGMPMWIKYYKRWLKGGSLGKGHEWVSLKLIVTTHTGDSKILANATRSYIGVEDLNTRNCALDGS